MLRPMNSGFPTRSPLPGLAPQMARRLGLSQVPQAPQGAPPQPSLPASSGLQMPTPPPMSGLTPSGQAIPQQAMQGFANSQGYPMTGGAGLQMPPQLPQQAMIQQALMRRMR